MNIRERKHGDGFSLVHASVQVINDIHYQSVRIRHLSYNLIS